MMWGKTLPSLKTAWYTTARVRRKIVRPIYPIYNAFSAGDIRIRNI
jgi:hypothetical protein